MHCTRKKIKFDRTLSLNCERCGRIITPPWLNTCSTGALDAGMHSYRYLEQRGEGVLVHGPKLQGVLSVTNIQIVVQLNKGTGT